MTKNRKLKKFFAFWGENFKKLTFWHKKLSLKIFNPNLSYSVHSKIKAVFPTRKTAFLLYIFILFSVGCKERYAYNERANFGADNGKPNSVEVK